MRTATLAAALTAVCINPAFAAQCGGTADFYGHLTTKYGEAQTWTGATATGSALTLWVNPETQTWTVLITEGSVSCLIASGTGFATIPLGDLL